jgi:dipeptidyl-peptidase-3
MSAAATVDEEVLKLHQIGADDCPVAMLDCVQPFGQLSQREKLYAHFLAAAGYEGLKINFFQTSYESPAIFELFHRVFASGPVDDLVQAAGFNETERKQLLSYYASFLGNAGNYKGFGDTKFVPSLPAERVQAFIKSSPAYTTQKDLLDRLWAAVQEPMYSLAANVRSLGFGEEGVSGYYSARCTKADAGEDVCVCTCFCACVCTRVCEHMFVCMHSAGVSFHLI